MIKGWHRLEHKTNLYLGTLSELHPNSIRLWKNFHYPLINNANLPKFISFKSFIKSLCIIFGSFHIQYSFIDFAIVLHISLK